MYKTGIYDKKCDDNKLIWGKGRVGKLNLYKHMGFSKNIKFR